MGAEGRERPGMDRARVRGVALAIAVAAALCALVAAAPAGAGLPTVDLSSDPWFVGWSSVLPSTYLGVDTNSSDLCVAGKIQCVDKVARRLESQVSSLGCNHNAVFALAYARTTETVAAWEQ